MFVRCFALFAILLFAQTTVAANPRLNVVDPWGVQRGEEIEVTFRGERLDDVQEALLYMPGVEVKELSVIDDKGVRAKLAVATDCRLGTHAVRLRAASGISNLQLFSVTALPVVSETEPNNNFDEPQAISLNTSVHGVVENEDVDYFVVEAAAGERITVEVEGVRLGYAYFDPYVAILNEQRFELASSDDSALLRHDGVCSLVAPSAGKYIIQVRETAFGGNGACRYLLHVGTFPRPLAVHPAGGKPGEEVEVTWLGDAAGSVAEKIKLPDAPGDAGIFAQSEKGIAPSPNGFRVSDLPVVLEEEPNNNPGEAIEFTAPAALHGAIGESNDEDHFVFSAKKGEVFDVRVFARNVLRSPLDSSLQIRKLEGAAAEGNANAEGRPERRRGRNREGRGNGNRRAGGALAANDDSGGPDSYLRFTVPDDGDYVIVLFDHLRRGGPNFTYRIEVTRPAASLVMRLPEREQYVPVVLNVPRGNRMALMVGAQRNDFGGPLQIGLESLPTGMQYETHELADDRGELPVLFTAAPDAPLNGALAEVIGRWPEAKDEAGNVTRPELVGRLTQRTPLVRGQNNREVFVHDADRLAAAVTEESPFSIEIVPPQVPLVRNGSMDLKIIAKRAEGFTAPIQVFMLYNPGGVGSSGNIQIAEGQTEVVLPLTANAQAVTRVWPIVVIGRAAVGNGPIEVSSQLVPLEVADSMFEFAFEKAAAEQGQETDVVVTITRKGEITGEGFAEKVRAELVGVPAGVEVEPIEFAPDAESFAFRVKLAADARVGRHQSLLCRATVTRHGEPILHTLGTGELRIDEPIKPKEVAAAPPPMEAKPPEEKPAEQPTAPKLSRLEQLRLQKQQEQGKNE